MRTIEEKITVETITTQRSTTSKEPVRGDDEDDEDNLRDIYLLSDFPFTISIHNITLGQYARKYFTVRLTV